MATPKSKKKAPADPTAALRQQRRSERLKKLKARTVRAVLTETQGKHLDSLLDSGYADNQSAAMGRALDEAFERHQKPTRKPGAGK